MKLYRNEIEVAEREDMTYSIMFYSGKYHASVHFRPNNRRWDTFKVGNENGYKTERGAMSAIKKDAARPLPAHPNGLTLVMA